MPKIPVAFDNLISCLARLPGVGRRSAERMAVSLVSDRAALRNDLIAALQDVSEKITSCSQCGSLTAAEENPCRLCDDSDRDKTILCVVEQPSDVLLIESAGGYKGLYHVLRGKISPMNKQGVNDIRFKVLIDRLDKEPVEEIILALNSDVESEATASFIREMLADRGVKISRPAMGIPAGSAMAYSDPVTLSRAMRGREEF